MKKTIVMGVAVTLLSFSVKSYQSDEIQKCLSGKYGSCQLTFQNPAKLNLIRWGMVNPIRKYQSKLENKGAWRLRLAERTRNAPLFKALQISIWQGDSSQLPFWLIQKYRERGLLPVLALSGQHVWALCFCLSLVGLSFWKKLGKPRGFLFFVFSQGKKPLALCLLFSFAWSEPSMIRTGICGLIAFVISRIPLEINLPYVSFLGCFLLVICFPELLSSVGFVLSASGFFGVITAGRFFSSEQKILGFFWLVLWFMPLIAFYFGKWVGAFLLYQVAVGFIWDQIFLPLLFFGGLLGWILPVAWANGVASVEEKLLRAWINWEAQSTNSPGLSVYRPSPIEVVVFLFWLIALAYWNHKKLLNHGK